MGFFEDNEVADTDVTEEGNDFLDNAHDTCVDLSEDVGEATNWIYDQVAGKVGLPDEVADDIGDQVGGLVEDNWENVCDLPENIGNNIQDMGDSIQDMFDDSSDNTEPDSDSTSDEG